MSFCHTKVRYWVFVWLQDSDPGGVCSFHVTYKDPVLAKEAADILFSSIDTIAVKLEKREEDR